MKTRFITSLIAIASIVLGFQILTVSPAHAALCDNDPEQVEWVLTDYSLGNVDYVRSEVGFKHCYNGQTNRWVDEVQWTRTTVDSRGEPFYCNSGSYFRDNYNFLDSDGHGYNTPAATAQCSGGPIVITRYWSALNIRVHSDSNSRWTNAITLVEDNQTRTWSHSGNFS